MIIKDITQNNNSFTISFKDDIEPSLYKYIDMVLKCYNLNFIIKSDNIEVFHCKSIIKWNDIIKSNDFSTLYNNAKILSNNLIKLSRTLKRNNVSYSYIDQPVLISINDDFIIIPMNLTLIHTIENDMITIDSINNDAFFISQELKHNNDFPTSKHFKIFYSSIGLILYDYLFSLNENYNIMEIKDNIKKLYVLPLYYILNSCLFEETIKDKIICYI